MPEADLSGLLAALRSLGPSLAHGHPEHAGDTRATRPVRLTRPQTASASSASPTPGKTADTVRDAGDAQHPLHERGEGGQPEPRAEHPVGPQDDVDRGRVQEGHRGQVEDHRAGQARPAAARASSVTTLSRSTSPRTAITVDRPASRVDSDMVA